MEAKTLLTQPELSSINAVLERVSERSNALNDEEDLHELEALLNVVQQLKSRVSSSVAAKLPANVRSLF